MGTHSSSRLYGWLKSHPRVGCLAAASRLKFSSRPGLKFNILGASQHVLVAAVMRQQRPGPLRRVSPTSNESGTLQTTQSDSRTESLYE
jgi:hypothetical protein